MLHLIKVSVGVLALASLAFAALACGDDDGDKSPAVSAPAVSEIAAGVGLKTIVGAAFAPQNVSIPVGSTITWTIASDEPHQVTFLSDAMATPEGSARQWSRTVEAGSTTPVDGSTFLHSGVMNKDEKINFSFPKTGKFRFLCPIHPGMEGTVDVVPEGAKYTTVSEAEVQAKKEADALLAQVEPARRETQTRATKESRPDGSTLWNVPTGPKVTVPTGYLEIKEYFPAELRIKRGDTVRWTFETSHSVTFLPPGEQLATPAPAATKPSSDYDGKSLYTSAVPPRQPGGPNPTFELRFPDAGTFSYICQLHYARLGHIGTVIVE